MIIYCETCGKEDIIEFKDIVGYKCRNCEYCEIPISFRFTNSGICRCNPPIPDLLWPIVQNMDIDWCGDFEPREVDEGEKGSSR